MRLSRSELVAGEPSPLLLRVRELGLRSGRGQWVECEPLIGEVEEGVHLADESGGAGTRVWEVLGHSSTRGRETGALGLSVDILVAPEGADALTPGTRLVHAPALGEQ